MTSSRFGAGSTAAEVVDGLDLSGRRAVVTGGGAGIGMETVRALAAAGSQVTMAVRDVDAAGRAAAGVRGDVRIERLDLLDTASVRDFAARWQGPLHYLINNAGIMALPTLQLSPDGWECQFAVNHLGHFALAVALHDALRRAEGARIVAVSSSSHLLSPVVFDDINFRRRPYEPFAAYAQSKTANVLFAVAASARWGDEGISAHAVMPGLIKTGIQRHVDRDVLEQAQAELEKSVGFKTAEQGAATTVFAATSPSLDGVPAAYLEDCAIAPVVDPGGLSGVARYALDRANAERLWELSAAAHSSAAH
jgi:NAD(P)-dependent dehydrogenase (short-subunit alcohol dehydrogenase family)